MQPLNPFLRSFFASKLVSQCSPASHFVLLVPTTEFLLFQTDTESQTSFSDLAQQEDFLSSHVLRIPGALAAASTSTVQNVREGKAKTKQYNTLNGRSVVVKDNYVYSNKGFKNLIQAQIVGDELYHADTQDLSQWLIYYISRPLLGAVKVPDQPKPLGPLTNGSVPGRKRPGKLSADGTRRDISSFNDLLDEFPMIARQLQPGLEKAYQRFWEAIGAGPNHGSPRSPATTLVGDAPSSPLVDENTPMLASQELRRDQSSGQTALNVEQKYIRDTLEIVILAALDLFQSVDKQQLLLVADATDLNGSKIERMIERHVAEHVHVQGMWPKLRNWKHDEDQELDNYLRQTGDVDILQVGIADVDEQGGKRVLSKRIDDSVTIFKKMVTASSPQEMLDILLETQQCITGLKGVDSRQDEDTPDEKANRPSNMTADTLVSLLLMVVIRSQVKQLHARLMYLKDFNYLTDVEGGHAGYAVSTFEAVLTYLSGNSKALRNISRTNCKLWHAVRTGDLPGIRALLDPTASSDTDVEPFDLSTLEDHGGDHDALANGHIETTNTPRAHFLDDPAPLTESNLSHVFPFEANSTSHVTKPKLKKRVSIDTRSRSSSSANSFVSGTSTVASLMSLINDETTPDQLVQSQDPEGRSILFMALESRQPKAFKYLLQMEYLIDSEHVLKDRDAEDTTLLSAAIQQGNARLVDMVLDYAIEHAGDEQRLRQFLATQDTSGRSVAHYCFSAPYLISTVGHLLPWQQKDKNGQTPLFAMCRSYDSSKYYDLAMSAITAAARQQGKHTSLQLADHIDNKGNTLLHIVNDTGIIQHMLFNCSSDPNATNEKRFTPLMVASKFARLDSMRMFFTDPRIDLQARDLRGLTAVEVAKDDEVRNRIDDMVLLLARSSSDDRKTGIVRGVLVDDGSIRLIIKSGAPSGAGSITVTTCRRSLTDFENLAYWLSLEQPASYIPRVAPFRSPFQITPKPSKQVLRDTQIRLNGFLQTMLSHPTFATHEMLWEFFLVPDMDPLVLAERAQRKGEIRVENLSQEYHVPLTSPQEISEIEIFTGHAIDQLHHVQSCLKTVVRRTATIRNLSTDNAEAHRLAFKHFSDVASFTPSTHIKALQAFASTLIQTEFSSPTRLLYNLHTALSSTNALLKTLTTRPQTLINSINNHRATLARASNVRGSSSIRRSRSPIPLIASLPQRLRNLDLLDTAASSREDAAQKADEALVEMEHLGRELRYTQTTVAIELAGWQSAHAKEVKDALKMFARGMVVRERERLDRMRVAVREVVRFKEERLINVDSP